VFLTLGHVFFGVNGIDRALRDANSTVNALIGIDREEIGPFTETVDGTNIHTVGVFTADTGFGDNVGHDKSVVKEWIGSTLKHTKGAVF
jgi:hypothetical protein